MASDQPSSAGAISREGPASPQSLSAEEFNVPDSASSDFWDARYRVAPEYPTLGDYLRRLGPLCRDVVLELRIHLNRLDPRHQRVADIGGGQGALLALLVDESNDRYLFDLSPEAVATARRLYGLQNAHVLDIVQTPGTPFGQFDLILCSEVIEHISPVQHPAFIAALHRWLKPGGYLVLSTPNLASLSSRLRLAIGLQPLVLAIDPLSHIAPMIHARIESLLGAQGFRPIVVRSTLARVVGCTWSLRLPLRFWLGEHLVGTWQKLPPGSTHHHTGQH